MGNTIFFVSAVLMWMAEANTHTMIANIFAVFTSKTPSYPLLTTLLIPRYLAYLPQGLDIWSPPERISSWSTGLRIGSTRSKNQVAWIWVGNSLQSRRRADLRPCQPQYHAVWLTRWT
jgi:hypothetical protein